MKTKCTYSRVSQAQIARDFGVTDQRGRRMGGIAFLATAVYSPLSADALPYASYTTIEPGTYYAFTPHATRNGERYGACQHTKLFATEAERAIAVEKYFAGAQKRAARKGVK